MSPPAAISPVSPPSPTLDDNAGLTEAGIKHHTLTNGHTIGTTNNKTTAVSRHVAPLDYSKLSITHATSYFPVPLPNSPEVWSQTAHTDHLLTISWSIDHGWSNPEIKPYAPLSLMPTASVLHYATECFEGMKAYRSGVDGKVRLFRPHLNAQRFNKSATRISLPGFDPEEFVKLLEAFVGLEAKRWIPKDRGEGFLYLRPTMIGTSAALGVQRPREALLYVVAILFPSLDEPGLAPNRGVGPMSMASSGGKTGKKKNGMRLLASRHDMIRAWPGGFGYAKVGANYGPSLVAQGEARERGYDQILWLFGEECYCTEAGGSNFFVIWKKKGGNGLEMVTAPLDDGVILEGITRRSVLEVAKERLRGEVDIVERKYTMHEVVEAYREGRLIEAFGSGTAFFIAPVQDIHFRGMDVELPLARGEEAKYATTIKRWLKDIMYGREQHPWGSVVKEVEEEEYDDDER